MAPLFRDNLLQSRYRQCQIQWLLFLVQCTWRYNISCHSSYHRNRENNLRQCEIFSVPSSVVTATGDLHQRLLKRVEWHVATKVLGMLAPTPWLHILMTTVHRCRPSEEERGKTRSLGDLIRSSLVCCAQMHDDGPAIAGIRRHKALVRSRWYCKHFSPWRNARHCYVTFVSDRCSGE